MDILTIAMIKHAVSKEVENTTTMLAALSFNMQQACESFKDALGLIDLWLWVFGTQPICPVFFGDKLMDIGQQLTAE